MCQVNTRAQRKHIEPAFLISAIFQASLIQQSAMRSQSYGNKSTCCRKKLAEVERAAASMVPPINSMSWAAAAMSPSHGSVMSNLLGFYVPGAFPPYSPPFMTTPSTFETPRSSMLHEPDVDDDIDVDIFGKYGSNFSLRIKREVIEDCWRKRCSHSNFGVLLTKKCFSEKKRATSKCTGDHCYGKKALSPNRLKAVREAIASVQPP